ncbi:MAG: multicopper oxidase domain-containing protein, partial [Actinomycetota bacterium]
MRAEPFSTPLPIPPTVRPGTDPIVLPVTRTAVSLLPGATTTMLTFGGSFPGPTVIARPGQVVDIDVVNELDEPAVLHLHGAHVAAVHDGHVRDLVPAGGQRRYTFDNAQRAAHLWYHDHLLMRTAERVYRGLAGSYLLIDPAHDGLGLPNGDERDIPVTLTDKTFDADGQLVYDPVGHTGFLGDVVLVNGVDRPVLTVEPGLLRLRILNASNARPYRLGRADGVPLVQVGTDGGLLAAPATRGEVEVWPSERVDLLLDLSRRGDGDRVVIVDAGVGDLMAVDVTGGPAEPAILPTSLGPAPALDPPEVVRTITLDEHGGRFLLNGHGFDDAVRDVYARLGAVERWRLVNTTSFGHPIHLHLVSFLVRQRTSSGVALHLRPEDEGWKDTVLVRAFETVELDARFADHLGDFMYHCHVLEHEDHDMMSQFRVVDLGRIAGSNRVRTAAAVSAHGGAKGGTVVVASGLEWAGALAGAALADALALV